MARVRRSGVTQVTLAIAVVLASVACSGDPDPKGRPTRSPGRATSQATALQDIDTTGLVVARAPFCDRVDPDETTAALGEKASGVVAYRSGQRIKISDEVADVVHEFGCRWTAGNGTAEAWVFAPPVTRKRAGHLAAEAANLPACGDFVGAPDFGRPSSACASGRGRTWTMRYQGLFGDAWLTCSLTLSDVSERVVDDRASRWCAAVAVGAASMG